MPTIVPRFGYGIVNYDFADYVTVTNVNAQNLFSSDIWNSYITKKIIIYSGSTIGADPTQPGFTGYALYIPAGFNGKIIVVNRGLIAGCGGLGGDANHPDGYDGGSAIYAGAPNIYIDNSGTGRIYAGAGGGAKGEYGADGTDGISGNARNIYDYQNGYVHIELSAYITGGKGGKGGAGGGGGRGKGFDGSSTSGYPGYDGTLGTVGKASNINIMFYDVFWLSKDMQYPPNSTINITNSSAYTRNMIFGSGSNITIRQSASGIGNVNTDGCVYWRGQKVLNECGYGNLGGLGGVSLNGNNSTLKFSLSSSGVYRLTKDFSQNYYVNDVFNAPLGTFENHNNTIYEIANQPGGYTETTPDYVSFIGNWGRLQGNIAIDGQNGTNGTRGETGARGGIDYGLPGDNSSRNTFRGGLAGCYVVNNSNVTWWGVGDIKGRAG